MGGAVASGRGSGGWDGRGSKGMGEAVGDGRGSSKWEGQ